MGSPEDFSNFATAVIHQGAFDRLKEAIEQAKASKKWSYSTEETAMIAKAIL